MFCEFLETVIFLTYISRTIIYGIYLLKLDSLLLNYLLKLDDVIIFVQETKIQNKFKYFCKYVKISVI